MYQKDYILRLIERLTEFIAAILGLLKKGEYNKASEAIQDAYRELLQKEASDFYKMPEDKIIEILEEEHRFNQQQLEVIAELFYAEAELQYLKKDLVNSKVLYQKSLIIFETLEKEQKRFSIERQTKISNIRNKILELS